MILYSSSQKEKIKNSLLLNKALLIDFDGTLVDYASNEKRALERLLEKLNIPYELHPQVKEDYSKINTYYWSQFELKKVTIEQVQLKRFEDLLKKYNIHEDPRIINQFYLESLVQTTVIEPEIIQSLKDFKKLGIAIIVITNGVHWTQKARLENTGIDKIIDCFLTSESVGFAKPHPKMFEDSKLFLQSINQPITNLWVIGDNFDADIKGGFNTGCFTCWINQKKDMKEINEQEIPTLLANTFLEFAQFYKEIKEQN